MITQAERKRLEMLAQDIRADVIAMLAKAGSGHPGGSLSIVDIMVSLYFYVLKVDPANPQWSERDRFHLSKGHGCPAFYAVLARRGYFPREHLMRLRQFGSILQGHPHPRTPGVEVASGSLGQGLSIACGMAIAGRLNKRDSMVYVLLGDGELQEGQVWEAALFAAHKKLTNLCVIIDSNGMQIDGKVEEIIGVQPLKEKWRSFGFDTYEVNGHDIDALCNVLTDVRTPREKPAVVIACTVKGKGVSFMEHNLDFHGRSPNEEETKRAIGELKDRQL